MAQQLSFLKVGQCVFYRSGRFDNKMNRKLDKRKTKQEER